VILAGQALDDLIALGQVAAGSRVDLVRSSIGMAVRAGAPKPDISSVDALKRTLLDAKIDRVLVQRKRRLSLHGALHASGSPTRSGRRANDRQRPVGAVVAA